MHQGPSLLPATRRPFRQLRQLADEVVNENTAALADVAAGHYGQAGVRYLRAGQYATLAERIARQWVGK